MMTPQARQYTSQSIYYQPNNLVGETDAIASKTGVVVEPLRDFYALLKQYALLMVELSNDEAQGVVQTIEKRQLEGREARDAANQIERLINDVGTSDKKTGIGEGIRAIFDKHNIEITTDNKGTKQTLKQWEKREKKVQEEGYQPPGEKKQIQLSDVPGISTFSSLSSIAFRRALADHQAKQTPVPTYDAAELRSLKAAAEGFSDMVSDSRTIEQLKVNGLLQTVQDFITMANSIMEALSGQMQSINRSMGK